MRCVCVLLYLLHSEGHSKYIETKSGTFLARPYNFNGLFEGSDLILGVATIRFLL